MTCLFKYVREGLCQNRFNLFQLHVASISSSIAKQNYDYFLVLDFEATCDENHQIHPNEIIEFPVLKINGRTLECESTFHTYVTPTVNPRLTRFCTNLTGITQDMVTNQPTLAEVLKNFHQWLENEKLLDPKINFIFVTCGDWDLHKMLPSQCDFFGISKPEYFNHWINIKRSFQKSTGKFARAGMMAMLEHLNIPHEGRHHSGIDDCKNIAEILRTLIRRGFVFTENRKR